METLNDVVKNRKCTGCGACFNVCPTKAISMVKNSEGFSEPKIDNEKCIHCGLCDQVCPILNGTSRESQYPIPKVYAGWNKDEKVRLKSSSGGVFSVLAEYFLKKKGFVCGAAFDEKNKLRHIIISSKKDLTKLRGSKYVQSEIGGVFREIRNLLEEDKSVLFSGTPCQTAGLKNFLKKEYEKLLVVDIVCHGTPSPVVFEKYLKEIERKNNKKITKINFRDKSTGWKSYSFTLSDEKEDILKEKFSENIFFEGFLKNLYLNKICTSCPYSQFPKCSDITLGDYWGIEGYDQKLDDPKGVSVIILNNDKGTEYLSLIRDELFLKKVDKNNSINKLSSINLPCESNVNRDNFFTKSLKSNGRISSAINNTLESNTIKGKKDVAILNMRFPTNNFGAILQSYAMSNLIRSLGYNPKVINYISQDLNQARDKVSTLSLDKFRENNIPYTLPCYTDQDLINLNKDFDIFIVGSDQVWNYNYLRWAFSDDIAKYFFNFVLPSKKLISYAASFAEDHWDGSSDEIKIVKKAINHFSSVSVREKSGVDICKKLFNIKAECVLDPTLLLGIDQYQSIINSESLDSPSEKYVAYFTLDNNLEENIRGNSDFVKFCKKRGFGLKNIRGKTRNVLNQERFIYNSVPAWLNYIKNSEFIITDSYHCIIFAVLFKKQFLCIERGYAGNERLGSLFSILGIKSRFFKSIKDIDLENLFKEELDYGNIEKNLDKEKKKSLMFLAKSLKEKKKMGKVSSILEEDLIDERILNKDLQSKYKELESQNQILGIKNQKLKKKVQNMEVTNQTLLIDKQKLELVAQSYLNRKAIRYIDKLKRVLSKLGFKKYR